MKGLSPTPPGEKKGNGVEEIMCLELVPGVIDARVTNVDSITPGTGRRVRSSIGWVERWSGNSSAEVQMERVLTRCAY